MSAEKHHHGAHARELELARAESAREDAELTALEAERNPPFTWGYFFVVFGLGIGFLSFFVWSLMSPSRAHRPPFTLIQGGAAAVGVGFIAFAITGRHLQNREDRKQRMAKA